MTARGTFPEADAERVRHYRDLGLWDDQTLADGVEEAADRRPDALAVADGERSLTWAETASAVARGTALLAAEGLVPGGHAQSPAQSTAVLVSGNTRHGVIAYHALLRSGATVVVLDRRCGAAELRDAFEVAGADAPLIIGAAEVERLRDTLGSARVIPLERFDALPATPPRPAAPHREPDRNRAAVVLFTSGTTSRPKGVVHSLNTLTAGARNMALVTGADTGTVQFLVSPLTSITGLMQVHLAADRHAAIVLTDRFDPDASLDHLNAVGATMLGGAPVIAERLLHAARARGGEIALTTIALGGAMLPRPLLELATDAFGIEIARVYGSSEAPNFTGSRPGDDRERRLSDDGAPTPGARVRVGSARHPAEGLLRGPSLFLGYTDPADDADAFEDGWYRSGDQVEFADGRLTVVGRLKDVANRNGLKISLAEIDAALEGLPGALECASFAAPDPETGERLAVAVRPAPDAHPSLVDAVEHLLARGLARRKLPEQLVRWDGPLPRTASGKIVRSRLLMDAPGADTDFADRLVPPVA